MSDEILSEESPSGTDPTQEMGQCVLLLQRLMLYTSKPTGR